MISPALEKELLEQLDKLAPAQQQQVLSFARNLVQSRPLGVPGRELLRFAGTIPPDDLAAMARAIEDGCEQINRDEW